jgi:hypothetical protein
MPRDGSNVYHRPPGTDGIPNYTIESAKYNSYVADVEQDLNTPRPIVAGGTGATNARDAMTSLQGDLAYQVVTNWDSFPFVSGSFYAASSASGTAPVAGHAFVGWCYTSDPAVTPPALPASNNLVIEARDQNDTIVPGKLYVREKKAGMWGAWTSGSTGNTTITASDPSLILNKPAAGHAAGITGQTNGVARWALYLGNSTAETGSNAGSDFQIDRFSDAGTLLGTPFNIGRATGNAAFTQSLSIGVSGGTGTLWFGNSGFKSIIYDGSNYQITGGAWVVAGQVSSASTAIGGTYQFGTSGTKYLAYDGTNFSLVGGPVNVNSTLAVGSSGSGGTLYFGSGTTKYLSYDGTNFNFAGGPLFAPAVNASGTVTAGISGTTGSYYFGNTGAKNLSYDGTKYIFAGGNVYHGSPSAQVDAPMATGSSTASVWAGGVSGVDRGIIYLTTAASCYYAYFTQGSTANAVGTISGTTTSTAYNTSSSGELKEDLKSFDAGNIIDATEVYDFAWKKTGERSYGVIAQQAIDVYPNAVTHMEVAEAEGGEFWGVDYSKYVPVLLQELKALRARVAALEGVTGHLAVDGKTAQRR